jgi:F-box-like
MIINNYQVSTEVAVEIFSYLNKKDLASCRQVSKSWNRCASAALLWKKLIPTLNVDALKLSGWGDNLLKNLYNKVSHVDDFLKIWVPRLNNCSEFKQFMISLIKMSAEQDIELLAKNTNEQGEIGFSINDVCEFVVVLDKARKQRHDAFRQDLISVAKVALLFALVHISFVQF